MKNIGCTHKTYDDNITEVHKVENLVSVKPRLSAAQYTDSSRKLYGKYTEEHAGSHGLGWQDSLLSHQRLF